MFHRTQLLLDRLDAFHRSGQWHSALSLCERLYQESITSRRAQDLLEAIIRTAFVYSAVGDRSLAAEHFELVLELAGRAGDSARLGRAYNGLGVLHQGAGEIDAAEAAFSEAQKAAEISGDGVIAGDVAMNLGILANIRGDLHEALEFYESAQSFYEKAGNKSRLAKILNNLGMLYTDLESYDEAAASLQRGLLLSRSVADLTTEGIIHTNRTELFLAIRRLDDARVACDEAFEFASRLGDSMLKADVLKSYGILYRETLKPHLAESHLQQAIELAQVADIPLAEAEATRELALVYRSQERNREALDALYRAHSLFSGIRARHDQADIASRLSQLEADFLSLVARWGDSIEAKDRYTSGHCQRVADYACMIAEAVDLRPGDLTWFRMGAFLHDVGKMDVPEEILNKPGRLSEAERKIIEHHTIAGEELLSSIEFPWDIKPMIRSHHERWDGKGYPDKLAGEEIPYTARILKIADVFDALTTTRSYRQPLTAQEAFHLMNEDEGSFDPQLFSVFAELLPRFEEFTGAE